MYRVVIKSRGKYNNIVLGARYCLTRRSVINLAVSLESLECEFDVEKFIRIHGDIFTWSDTEVSEKIRDKFYETLEGGNKDA